MSNNKTTRISARGAKPSGGARPSSGGEFSPFTNLPGTDLPSGDPNFGVGAWQPFEIVLVKWQLTRAASPVQPSVDRENSGVYCHHTLVQDNRQYLQNIRSFVADYAAGTVNLPMDKPYDYSNPTGNADFTIWHPCYVVFVLENNFWRFQEGIGTSKAIRTGYPQPAKIYSDLYHMIGNGFSPNIGNHQCQYAHFSAGSMPDISISTSFNLFFDYIPIGGLDFSGTSSFDPAIKNDGHTTFRSHVPLPRRGGVR
jgi:hypothetical protein